MIIKQISNASCTYTIMQELNPMVFSIIVKIIMTKIKRREKIIIRYKTLIGTYFV